MDRDLHRSASGAGVMISARLIGIALETSTRLTSRRPGARLREMSSQRGFTPVVWVVRASQQDLRTVTGGRERAQELRVSHRAIEHERAFTGVNWPDDQLSGSRTMSGRVPCP